MLAPKRKRSTIDLGHDSFLDIVANLVGILIILVVVLGAQSTEIIRRAMTEVDDATEINLGGDLATASQMDALASESMRAAAAQADSNRLESLVKKYDQELLARKARRAMLIDLLAEAEAAWEASQKDLEQEKLKQAKLQTQFIAAQRKLEELQGSREAILDESAPVVAVEHLPTPMAKTVFGEEIHLRLKDNRVSVVPIDSLVKELERDLQRNLSGSRQGQFDGAIGPIRGYVARYVMEKRQGVVTRGGRAQMATRVQVVGMKLEPTSEPHGQPMSKTLNGTSELDIELAGHDPGTTTVTVWVYPESFGAFRQLKERLYAKGFATAARPLPKDEKIGLSSQGSRSSAQ